MAKCKLNSEISPSHSITVCYKQDKKQMKITVILTFSQSRSHSEKNLCEDIENRTMDDLENDMKKTDVKQVKKYHRIFTMSAELSTKPLYKI